MLLCRGICGLGFPCVPPKFPLGFPWVSLGVSLGFPFSSLVFVVSAAFQPRAPVLAPGPKDPQARGGAGGGNGGEGHRCPRGESGGCAADSNGGEGGRGAVARILWLKLAMPSVSVFFFFV